MNIVTIDPSLNCTAVVINDKKVIYAKEEYGVSEKTGCLKKWFELCEPLITYRWLNYVKTKNHSDQEIIKLNQYTELVNLIINDIKQNINPDEETIVGIEGYSYSSKVGPLIDLVTLSTLLRFHILSHITKNVIILQPSRLKLEAAKLTYTPIEKGVKVKHYEYRNHQGVSGGKFKKPEILMALVDNPQLNCEWVNFLRLNKDDILSLNGIPKPIEDMNDAKIFYEILKKNKYFK